MVVTNSLPGDIARDFMQIQGDGQTFFAGHDPVALDLLWRAAVAVITFLNNADAEF
jgi:hypothetical protein